MEPFERMVLIAQMVAHATIPPRSQTAPIAHIVPFGSARLIARPSMCTPFLIREGSRCKVCLVKLPGASNRSLHVFVTLCRQRLGLVCRESKSSGETCCLSTAALLAAVSNYHDFLQPAQKVPSQVMTQLVPFEQSDPLPAEAKGKYGAIDAYGTIPAMSANRTFCAASSTHLVRAELWGSGEARVWIISAKMVAFANIFHWWHLRLEDIGRTRTG